MENRDPRQALKEARIHVEDVLGASLLPSLQLLPANPAVGLAIWDVMSLLPYEVNKLLTNFQELTSLLYYWTDIINLVFLDDLNLFRCVRSGCCCLNFPFVVLDFWILHSKRYYVCR